MAGGEGRALQRLKPLVMMVFMAGVNPCRQSCSTICSARHWKQLQIRFLQYSASAWTRYELTATRWLTNSGDYANYLHGLDPPAWLNANSKGCNFRARYLLSQGWFDGVVSCGKNSATPRSLQLTEGSILGTPNSLQ